MNLTWTSHCVTSLGQDGLVFLVVYLQGSAVATAAILEEKCWILAQSQDTSCVSMSWTLAIISCQQKRFGNFMDLFSLTDRISSLILPHISYCQVRWLIHLCWLLSDLFCRVLVAERVQGPRSRLWILRGREVSAEGFTCSSLLRTFCGSSSWGCIPKKSKF